MFSFTFTESETALLKAWAHELHTTTKKQAQGGLRMVLDKPASSECGYCCLGIYSDLRGPELWETSEDDWWICLGDDREVYYDTQLPDTWAEELGLTKRVSCIRNPHKKEHPSSLNTFPQSLQEMFIEMNDDHDYTFPMIAKEIDSLLETGDFTKETQLLLTWVPKDYDMETD